KKLMLNIFNIHSYLFILSFKQLFICVITDRVTVSVSVMEGDSVTLYTNVTTTQQDEILWYFNDTRIAVITGDLSRICTDVQCNEDTERFRDRLNLETQTGSLTIKNIQTADTGVYQLKIFSSSSISDKTFSATVDVPDKVKTISVKEGESVTFDPGVIKTANYVMTWYFNETLIAEITGDQSKICTDDECRERFRDRLKLNNQTGSLTITNTRTTDSGEYKLLIISRILQNSVSITSLKTFIFTVIGETHNCILVTHVLCEQNRTGQLVCGQVVCHVIQCERKAAAKSHVYGLLKIFMCDFGNLQ
uniref:Immunoglobulin domain-containing protein n=1 Tax=Cyprinus carpio TaxID=7962 RepID=A0A8C2HPN5_CYPCA